MTMAKSTWKSHGQRGCSNGNLECSSKICHRTNHDLAFSSNDLLNQLKGASGPGCGIPSTATVNDYVHVPNLNLHRIDTKWEQRQDCVMNWVLILIHLLTMERLESLKYMNLSTTTTLWLHGTNEQAMRMMANISRAKMWCTKPWAVMAKPILTILSRVYVKWKNMRYGSTKPAVLQF